MIQRPPRSTLFPYTPLCRSFRTGVGPFTPGSPMASEVGMDALNGPRSLESARQLLAATGKAGAKVATLNPADQINNSTLTTDRKSTRLNSSHANISYAVFCL